MNHLNIQLSFDAPTSVSAGKTIQGILHVVAPRTVKAEHLVVCFRGEEYAKVYVRRGSRVRTYDERQEITRIDISASKINSILQQNQNRLPEGRYQIPFEFRISSKLPSSVEFGDCNESIRIEYCLQAEMIGSGLIHDYGAKHIIDVTARPKSLKTVPYVVPPQSHTIMAGLFFDRGRLEFGALADDTLLVPGQQLKLDLVIGNPNTLPASIHAVRVHLQEFAEWTVHENENRPDTSEQHTTSRTICLFDEELDATDMFHKQMDKTKKHNFLRESMRMKQNFQQIEQQLAAMEAEAASPAAAGPDESVLSLKLPPVPKVAHTSYKGKFMKVSHLLTVTLQTHAVNSNPEFQIPIRIMRGRPSQLLQYNCQYHSDTDEEEETRKQQQQHQQQPNDGASKDTSAAGVPSIFRPP